MWELTVSVATFLACPAWPALLPTAAPAAAAAAGAVALWDPQGGMLRTQGLGPG